MKIGFIGCVASSERFLSALLRAPSSNFEVVGVVTLAESKINADFVDLRPLCEAFKVPIYYEDRKNRAGSVAFFKACKPDVVFCMGWSYLLDAQLLSLPPMGVIGFHPAQLPQNRGRHPIIWALALGLERTASTLFQMDEAADSGPILSQIEIPIESTDDAGTLYDKILDVAEKQVVQAAFDLVAQRAVLKPQDSTISTYWRKRSRADGLIDWRMHAESIHHLVRSLAKPYPGAEFEFQEQSIKVWESEISKRPYAKNIEPGKVLAVQASGITVKCGLNTAILLKKLSQKLSVSEGEYL